MPTSDPQGLVPDRADTALVILDLISDFSFEGGAKLARAALPVAKRIARLKSRASKAGVPVIYVNDGLGRWRSDFPGLVRHCAREGSRGAPLVRTVAPEADDYCVLFTANDAHVRDLELSIPRDCISARNPQDTRLALEYFTRVLDADTRHSTALRLPRRRRRTSR